MPSNDTKMLHFIHRFLTDEPFRCRVLHKELDTMKVEADLSQEQVEALLSLTPNTILQRLLKDLGAAAQACDDRRAEQLGGPPVPAPAGLTPMAVAMMYGQGEIHLRGITPPAVSPPGLHTFRIRGQGFGPEPGIDIEFTHVITQQKRSAAVVATSCDPDILQRVTVEVNVDLVGDWSVRARNFAEDWTLPAKELKIKVNA